MKRRGWRRAAAILAITILLAISAGPARVVAVAIGPATRGASEPSRVGVAPAPCDDRGYSLEGAKWFTRYKWEFNAASTPRDLGTDAVRQVLLRSFANITGAHNDCGLRDLVSARSRYDGTTKLRANCSTADGHNVIGFGRLPYNVLAVTCYWFDVRGRMTEADMKINSREKWALTLDHCRDLPVLEATVTHEAGHVFGLDHVSERRHGRLTMSPYIDGPCENGEATLGLGDVLGLEALY